MRNLPFNRMSMALSLGFVVVAAQLIAFTVIASNAWSDLFSPSTPFLKMPLIQLAEMHRGEIVFPLCGMRVVPGALQSGIANSLRFMDVKTGRVRELRLEGAASSPMAIVSNGNTLWVVCQHEIFETDGRQVVKHEPRRSLGFKSSVPFLYENVPTIIERDANGNHHLTKFVDGNWQLAGRIVLPGANRTWTVDERTGNSVLVPRTSANFSCIGLKAQPIRVLPVNGQFHLFHIEGKSFRSNADTILGYRSGFDFVASPSVDEPVSAMVPENAAADTAGWVLLDSRMASMFPCHAARDGKLLLGNDHEVWQQAGVEGPDAATKFERIAEVDRPKGDFLMVNLVSSPDTDEVYVLAGDPFSGINIFRLNDNQLQKQSHGIEGMAAPMKRWAGGVFLQGLAVICVSTIAMILVAAWWVYEPHYSSGHETVVLAPVIRRSLARCLDLSLIFGPLVIQTTYLVWQSNPETMLDDIADFDSLSSLLGGIGWSVLVWMAMVISTGIWGMTSGKWLFSLRVVRTTLRPCGLTRALMRELLLWLDTPQFLTVLPGVICFLISRKRQRIGDLAAGTLVIDIRG